MPPRFSYWTIIAGGLPTAFRTADREELLPTFTRLKEKHPDAEMKWFARGKLWTSPEEASEHAARRRAGGRDDDRRHDRDREGAGSGGRAEKPREARGRDWRPGGDHHDPRQKFKDAKKARNQRIKADKFDRRSRRDEAPPERPHGDSLAPEQRPGQQGSHARESFKRDRPSAPAGRAGGDRGWKPHGERPSAPRGKWTDREPRAKPHGDRPSAPHGKWTDREPRAKPRGDRPSAPRGKWTDREPRAKPHGDRPSAPRGKWTDREPRAKPHGDRPPAPRGKWTDREPRTTPHDDRLTRPPHTRDGERRDRPSTFKSRDNSSGPRAKPSFTPRERPSFPPREKSSFKPRDDRKRDWSRDRSSDGRGAYRGDGHGDNAWKPKPPRESTGGGSGPGRPFAPRKFDRDRTRGGGTEEPPAPARPRGPNREPKPSEQPEPSAPPRPSEPITAPPGPPERGRLNRNKRRR